MIIISFEDFSKLASEGNKRIYYFQMDNILELTFLTEGIFVKSLIDLDTIENKEEFFGKQMFVNATKLLFRITNPAESNIGLLNPGKGIIDILQPIETKEQDKNLVKEGIQEE